MLMDPLTNQKKKGGRKVADVWTYFMTEEATSVDEFRSMHKNTVACPSCKHTVSHWGKVDRLEVMDIALFFRHDIMKSI